MNIIELTSQQLRRAASIKEKLDALNKALEASRPRDHQRGYIRKEANDAQP
jgi:hypothetical protein